MKEVTRQRVNAMSDKIDGVEGAHGATRAALIESQQQLDQVTLAVNAHTAFLQSGFWNRVRWLVLGPKAVKRPRPATPPPIAAPAAQPEA